MSLFPAVPGEPAACADRLVARPGGRAALPATLAWAAAVGWMLLFGWPSWAVLALLAFLAGRAVLAASTVVELDGRTLRRGSWLGEASLNLEALDRVEADGRSGVAFIEASGGRLVVPWAGLAGGARLVAVALERSRAANPALRVDAAAEAVAWEGLNPGDPDGPSVSTGYLTRFRRLAWTLQLILIPVLLASAPGEWARTVHRDLGAVLPGLTERGLEDLPPAVAAALYARAPWTVEWDQARGFLLMVGFAVAFYLQAGRVLSARVRAGRRALVWSCQGRVRAVPWPEVLAVAPARAWDGQRADVQAAWGSPVPVTFETLQDGRVFLAEVLERARAANPEADVDPALEGIAAAARERQRKRAERRSRVRA